MFKDLQRLKDHQDYQEYQNIVRDYKTEWCIAQYISSKDLLPTVCSEEFKRHPKSSLKSPFKIPSIVVNQADEQYFIGISKWKDFTYDIEDINNWSSKPYYGIMLRSKDYLGIDVDCEDLHLVMKIDQFLKEFLNVSALPYRYRNNSSRRMYLLGKDFYVEKKIFTLSPISSERNTPPILELLGDSQVLQLFGIHKSGYCLKWNGLDILEKRAFMGEFEFFKQYPDFKMLDVIPSINIEQYKKLYKLINDNFCDDENRSYYKERKQSKIYTDMTSDSVIKSTLYNLIIKSSLFRKITKTGDVIIKCPKRHLHTTITSDNDTIFYPARNNNTQVVSSVNCFHSSHGKITMEDVIEYIEKHDNKNDNEIITQSDLSKSEVNVDIRNDINGKNTVITRKIGIDNIDVNFKNMPDLVIKPLLDNNYTKLYKANNSIEVYKKESQFVNNFDKIRSILKKSEGRHYKESPRFLKNKEELKAWAVLNYCLDKADKYGIERINPSRQAIPQALKEIGVEARFNLYTKQGEVWIPGNDCWVPFEDDDCYELIEILQTQYDFAEITFEKMIRAKNTMFIGNTYDSVYNWIDSLKWDGVNRLDHFTREVFKFDECYTTHEQASIFFRYFFTAAAGRFYGQSDIKADMILVLCSPEQGIGKSSFIQALAPTTNFYTSVVLQKVDKDLIQMLSSRLIIELAEISPLSYNSSTTASWNNFITTSTDTWRPPYGRNVIETPRRCMMIGTSNHEQFITDATGARRWLPMTLTGNINLKYIKDNRDQLYAEALIAFKDHGVEYAEAEQSSLATISSYYTRPVEYSKVIEYINDRIAEGYLLVAKNEEDKEKCRINKWYEITTDEIVDYITKGQYMHNLYKLESKIKSSLKALGWVRGSHSNHYFSCREAMLYALSSLPIGDSDDI